MNDQTTEQCFPVKRKGGGRWKTVLLSILLLGGLLGVLAFVFRDQLTPATPVETGRVVLLAEAATTALVPGVGDELLFQASGWLEPDPWPTKVSVLTDGFVKEVFFKEGEMVTSTQLLARLDQEDAELALREAKAKVSAAAAEATKAQDRWKRINALREEFTTPAELIAVESDMLQKKAELESAQVARDVAELTLQRTEVRAPMDGIVLRRFVDPGSKRGREMDDPNSAVIASLFDPAKLQVRVDVPLAESGRLFVGQPTRISTAMLPGQVFTGRVTLIAGEADLQRNTLQAKVEVHEPDPRMRPEVLCRVEFRGVSGAPVANDDTGTSERRTLWIPEKALTDVSLSEQKVWVVDPVSRKVEHRVVRLGDSRRDGYRRVLEGLRANEAVVTAGGEKLESGRRVSSLNREDSR